MTIDAPHPLDFFAKLRWLDGRCLLGTIEPYRQAIFESVLCTFDGNRPLYNLAVCGRAKKNWKTSDLILAALYRLLVWPSPQGNDCFILANDEGQAADDLDLAKKLVVANPIIAREVEPRAKEIIRRDGAGRMQILPARDIAGAHGKTYLFVGFDEIHAYRSHDLFEALAPDPSRLDALTWITSYAGIRHAAGIPLYDLMQAGKHGDDHRMYFSWYGADFTTDPAFEEVPSEQRANPSMASWGNDGYLEQQRRRLPTHKFRRLHLNLPGAPDSAAYSADAVMSAIVAGRKHLDPEPGRAYAAFVDMSGGSSDDAVLAIAHYDAAVKRSVLDLLVAQTGKPPFDAVRKFAALLKTYGLARVHGDAYAGQTFRADFGEHGVAYEVAMLPKTGIYDALEPKLNAGEVELLDIAELQEQLLTLILRSGRIDHQPGDHDDYANGAAGALWLVAGAANAAVIAAPIIVTGGYGRFDEIGGPTPRSGLAPNLVKDNVMELDAVRPVNRRKETAKGVVREPAVGNVPAPPPEEIVAELKDKLSQAKVRQTAISSERRAVALAAHMASADDRARLDQLNQEGAILSGEIEGIEAAISDIQARIANASADAAQERRELFWQQRCEQFGGLVSVKINDGVVMAAGSASSFASGMVCRHADKIVNLRQGVRLAKRQAGAS